MRTVAAACAVSAVLALPAGAAPAASGLHGYVRMSPTTPVCRPTAPCDAPAVGVTLSFKAGTRVIARARTSETGFYRVTAPAGIYVVTTNANVMHPVPSPTRVKIRRGHDDRLDFHLDTGIR